MIVKSKRIRARGQGLARTLRHLMDGEDNDAVELVSGTVANLEDARSDALRFGRQYAARHWIISPAQRISREQLVEFVNWLAVEFGFDLELAVIWAHTKSRATEDGCNEHYHVCVGEVDPITGGVMSTSHDWARHEKLARRAELAWGHAIVPGRHTAAVVAALEEETDADAPTALRDVTPIVHRKSFDEVAHQRLKRAGYDLPRLRVLIGAALSSSMSLEEFEAKLVALGLRLRAGDKNDTPIIEAINDGALIGSLARLTRLRKGALMERLKFDAAGQPTAKAEHSRSDVFSTQAVVGADRARVEACGRRSDPARSNRHHDSAAGGDRNGGESGSRASRTPGIPAQSATAATLMLRIGCHRQHARLLDLLSIARRAAMPPSERVDFELHDRIEDATMIMNQTGELPEPAALLKARRVVDEATGRLRELERRLSDLDHRIDYLPKPTIWNHLMGSPREAEKERLQAKSETIYAKIRKARSELVHAKQGLTTEQARFGQERSLHSATLAARQQQAMKFIKIGEIARTRLARSPELGFAGAAHVLRLAALPRSRNTNLASGDAGEFDDVVLHDQWGKPYKANPLSSW